MKRGDNIPSIADYSHYNEEAEQVWYAENRYDMEHWDEDMDDMDDDPRYYDDDEGSDSNLQVDPAPPKQSQPQRLCDISPGTAAAYEDHQSC